MKLTNSTDRLWSEEQWDRWSKETTKSPHYCHTSSETLVSFLQKETSPLSVRHSWIKKLVPQQKAGAIAPCTVSIPAGPTGMEPTKTSFLQALNIPSKITRGQIEIISAQVLITEGEKVGSSEATLLQMLNIKPFEYMLKVTSVYDAGSIYSAKVLDLTDDDILAKFHSGVSNIAAIGLTIGYPTVASLPHSIIRAYKKVLSITLATNYTFPRAELVFVIYLVVLIVSIWSLHLQLILS